MQKIITLFLFAISLCLLQSCATVFGSRSNSLNFVNEEGQTAEVYLDGKKIGDAPGKIKLPAREIQQGSKLELRSKGYPTQEYTILRRVSPGYTLLNVVSTAGLGMAVDFGTGYIYRPTPRKFDFTFTKEQSTKTDD